MCLVSRNWTSYALLSLIEENIFSPCFRFILCIESLIRFIGIRCTCLHITYPIYPMYVKQKQNVKCLFIIFPLLSVITSSFLSQFSILTSILMFSPHLFCRQTWFGQPKPYCGLLTVGGVGLLIMPFCKSCLVYFCQVYIRNMSMHIEVAF